jgi:hypothetical protein
MTKRASVWKKEPVILSAVVYIVLMLAIFKLKLTPDQTTMALTALTAAFAGIVRQTVSSPATVAKIKADAEKP